MSKEGFKPTEQKIGLSPLELETALKTVKGLIPEFRSAISEISDLETLKYSGWCSYWRKQVNDSKWQWANLDVGHLAVGQKKVLRGPQGEVLDLDVRYNPINRDENPDFFNLSFTDDNNKRLRLDLNMKSFDVPTLDLFFDTEDSNYLVRLSYEKRKLTVKPKEINGIVLFFQGLDFNDKGILNLSRKDHMQVGECVATPDHYKASLKRPIDAVKWYLDQNYVEERVSDVVRWIENLPPNVDLVKELALIEAKAKKTLQTIWEVARNSSLGKVWTEEDDNLAFEKFHRDSTPARREASS